MPAPATPTPPAAEIRTTFVAWLIAAVLASPFCFVAVQETDIGWHLALGRTILTQHAIPRTNTLTWTAPDYPYYPTSWLFDVTTYGIVSWFGPAGLQLFTCVLLLITLAALALACRYLHRWGPWLVPATALLLLPRVTPRPHMVSWAVEAGVLVLGVIGRDRSWRWRLACVPLIVLGSNSHAGAIFAAGILALFSVEAAMRSERRWHEVAIAGAGVLALAANPGGLYNIFYAAGNLSVFAQLPVDEMKPPGFEELPAFFVMLALTLIAAIVQLKRRPMLLAMTLIYGALGLYAVRQAFEFYLVAVPVLAGLIEPFRQRSGGRGVALIFGLFVTLAMATSINRVGIFSPSLSWDQRVLPVRAARYIADRKLGGRHFNSFGDGGYLEYALPGLKAFQDGRVQAFPPEFFTREIAGFLSPADFDAYLSGLDVHWALTTSNEHGFSGNGMLQGPSWALVYWDDASELYVRRDAPELRELVDQDEFRYYVPSTSESILVSRAGALPREEATRLLRESMRFLESRPHDPTAMVARCAALTRLDAAEAPKACDDAMPPDASSDRAESVRTARQVPKL